MKNLYYLFAIFLLFSCNNDDDAIEEPDIEPVVANAKVLYNGTCGDDHYFVELQNVPADSLPNGVALPFYTFLEWPDAYRIENLEVYVDYRNPNLSELMRPCNALGRSPHRFVAREILLPTE